MARISGWDVLAWVTFLGATVPVGQESRQAVPDSEAIAKAEVLIKGTYKDEYAKNQPAPRKALSKKLLEPARDRTNDSALRFVLYRESNILAQPV